MHLNTERLYKLIAIISFVVLMLLQYQLISSTYEIKSKDLFKTEKSKLKAAYEKAIINDKLYPGGQAIIDSILLPQMRDLEKLYHTDGKQFKSKGSEIYDRIVAQLRRESPMDSLFVHLLKKEGLEPKFKYSLVLWGLSVTFDGRTYIDLVSSKMSTEDNPVIISGETQFQKSDQLVSSLSISSHQKYSNRVEFALYADKEGRMLAIIKDILPLLLLSGCCLLAVVAIYFLTFNNWVKQKKMNEMTTDFLNNITHEFNTPLATIQVASKNVRRGIAITGKDTIHINLDIIDRQTGRLDKLINQAIDVSKFSPYHVEKDVYNLHELLEEIATDLQIKYGTEAKMAYHRKPDEGQVNILTNRFMFTTLMNNLVENGVKYNSLQDKEISIWTAREEHIITLHVKDNGDGMDRETYTHMFDKFYRGKQEQPKNGVGLGLYYVQQSAAEHGWRIQVETTPKSGTEFILYIPIVHIC